MAEELPITERVLDERTLVQGIIYCIEQNDSGKQYVGQTVTHRLNKGKYRPYGVRRRFAEHCSNALCNTKPSQSSCLYNEIRLHGSDAFTYFELEVCPLESLDSRERYWIDQQSSTYPAGYNLTTGGNKGSQHIATIPTPPRSQPRQRGGCAFRTTDTRARMSVSVKASLSSTEAKAQRSASAKLQHSVMKAVRFAGVTIDRDNLDQYITVRKGLVLVSADGQQARFAGKHEASEALVSRAKEFLLSISIPPSTNTISHIESDSVSGAIATLPNCSGNP
jgi:hypothetical protein